MYEYQCNQGSFVGFDHLGNRKSPVLETGSRLFFIIGMQFGSEGKGGITCYLAPLMCMAIRTGAANAGHTIFFRGQPFVMRQLPSAWINPVTELVIGLGAIISLDVLLEEIAIVDALQPIKHRLFIDRRAHVVTTDQKRREARTDLAQRIGSTSARSREGIGMATADKILRRANCVQAQVVPALQPYLADTVDLINTRLDRGAFVQLEGTQGFGLDLDHGQFPYTTSRGTTVSALAASCGINPQPFQTDIIGVVRTYPIRVAGNSGPFGRYSKEITWQRLTRCAGAPELIEEKISVTNRIRRVATWSWDDLQKAVQVNRPTELALTFADYLDWSIHGKIDLTRPVESFIAEVEEVTGVPVTLVKTAPQTVIDYNHYRSRMICKLG